MFVQEVALVSETTRVKTRELMRVGAASPVFPRSTKMRWPLPPVKSGDLSLGTPMMFSV